MTSPDPLNSNPGAAPGAQSGVTFKEDYARQCEAEFSAFYEANFRKLTTAMVCNGIPVAQAIDFSQEAMLEAYKAWPTINHPFRWVHRVASRKFARHLSSTREVPTGHISNLLVSSNDVIQKLEKKLEVQELLDSLPARQRQVLTLSILGYRPLEIAKELGISPDAARRGLFKARQHAKLFFGVEEEDR
ncbi:RNA polymerase sigma factor [Streptomyces sp. NPDC088197]|uniref:RNA polymerase sigma factor n=1 Tax=unclassified Streptomyces TaxID=2593676 RepID=UPI0036EDE27E